jgi:hypothetical protein
MAGFFAQARDKFRKTVAAAHVLRIAGCCHHRFQPARLTSGTGQARHASAWVMCRAAEIPARQVPMKIVLVGPLSIALGLFWFGQGVGLISGSHNAVLVDVGAGVASLGIGLLWFALR